MRTLLLVAGAIAIALATPAFARTHRHAHSSYDAYAAERLPEVRVYAPRENPGYVPQQYPGYPGYYDAYGAYRGSYASPFIGHDPDPFIEDYLHFDPPGNYN